MTDEKPLEKDRGLGISETARKVLRALGYDPTILTFIDGGRRQGHHTEWRRLVDPKTETTIGVTDSYSKEAPAASVYIEARKIGGNGQPQGIQFVFDRARNSLLTMRFDLTSGDKSPFRSTPEVITSNFSTGRSFQGQDAVDAMGALYLRETVRDAKPDLQKLHLMVSKALRGPAPKEIPTPGRP